MTKDETVKQLVFDLDQLCRRLPQDERALMWHAVLTSLAMDMGAAYQGKPPSEWFNKVAGASAWDLAAALEARSAGNPGPVMTATKPGEA